MTKRHDRLDPDQGALSIGGVERVGLVSGPPLERVAGQWALPVDGYTSAHWYDAVTLEGARRMLRLCDGRVDVAGHLLEPGSFPSCRRCRKIINGKAVKT